MSVISADVCSPAPLATSTRLVASAVGVAALRHEGAVADLHVEHQGPSPAASFLDRMEAVMSGTDSTVAVTSRIA